MINQTTIEVVDLIVPHLNFKIKPLRWFGMLIFFFCSISPAYADVHRYGCWIPDVNPNVNRIWYILDPTHPGPTNFLNDLNGNGTDDNYYQLQNRCANSLSISCTVYQRNGDIRGYGYLADYSVDYCPLDDYELWILLVLGMLGVFNLANFEGLLKIGMRSDNNSLVKGKYR